MFTVSVLFRGQILYRYYKRYLQFRLICDKLESIQDFISKPTTSISCIALK